MTEKEELEERQIFDMLITRNPRYGPLDKGHCGRIETIALNIHITSSARCPDDEG